MTLQDSLTEYDDTVAKVSKPISGLLGISLNGERQVQHATRNGFVYVRLRDSLSEVVQAYNDKVSPVYDLPVLIERKGNRWYVVGRDTERYSNWGTSAPFLPKHGGQHSFNRDAGTGGDIVPIYPDQFMPALVYPSGTTGADNLIVAPYLLQRHSDFVFVGNTGTQPLTIYKPTNNQARMGLVTLNRITGNPEILMNSGTSFSASVTGTAGVAPYIPYPSPTQEPLYAFRLVSGTVAITWSNLYNVRQFFRQIQTGSAGGGASLTFQDEGVPLGTPGTVNFVGGNVSVTVSGTVARVFVTGSSGGGVPTFISGSVPYSGGDGILKENNPEFKYREAYKQLLLGTELPFLGTAGNQIKLGLVGDQDTTITEALMAFGTGTSGSPSPSFNGYRARGTHLVPLPVQLDDALQTWIGAGYDGSTFQNAVRVRAYADGNWITGTHTPSKIVFETTPSGTTSRATAMTIGSDGNIYIASGKEYRVNGAQHPHSHTDLSNIGTLTHAQLDISVPLQVKNTSGATANANDVGYLVYTAGSGYEYKTTTTLADERPACVVLVGGANNSTIYVVNRGLFTLNYSGSAPAAGDLLVLSSTTAQVTVSSTMRPEVMAIAMAAGSGGTVDALLLTQSTSIKYTSANDVYRNNAHSQSNFVGTINGTPTAISVAYNVTSGFEDLMACAATSQLAKLLLYNSTRGTYRYITACNTGTNTITTVSSTDAWANGDTITLASQDILDGLTPTYIGFDLSQQSEIPPLARSIIVNGGVSDSGGAGYICVAHPAVAYSVPKIITMLISQTTQQFPYFLELPLYNRRFGIKHTASGTGVKLTVMKIMGYVLATP